MKEYIKLIDKAFFTKQKLSLKEKIILQPVIITLMLNTLKQILKRKKLK